METTAKPKVGPLTYCNGPLWLFTKVSLCRPQRFPLVIHKDPPLAIHKGPPLVGNGPQTQRGTLCDKRTAKQKGGTLCDGNDSQTQGGHFVTETTAKPKGGPFVT